VISSPRTFNGENAAACARELIYPTDPDACPKCDGVGEVPTYLDEYGNWETGLCLRCDGTGAR
jgi:hypothetical protein